MLYLVLSVCCSVLLGFAFKLFPRFGIDRFQAIVFNYCTCVICGWIQLGRFPVAAEGLSAPWLPFAVLLGFVFISGFNLAAMTVQYFGVTVSQVMQKMSILLSVPFAIIALHESTGLLKILGLSLALISILLVNWPSGINHNGQANAHLPNKYYLALIPLGTWLLTGVIEVVLLHVQHFRMIDPQSPVFVTTIFGVAGALGLGIMVEGWRTGRILFSWRNVLGGIALGIPNYGSMLFMIMALGSGLEGSFVLPAINVSIIILTTIGAVVLFQERLSRTNWIGIVFALTAITLISM
jgi:drug/metabolite transporter (DMT)-like permease